MAKAFISAIWDYTLCVAIGLGLGLPWQLALAGPLVLRITKS
jgi:hypothetical protein